jgi:hypothetical protein
MAKAGDALLALNKVLQGFDTSIKRASSKSVVYTVKSNDRAQLAADVNAALKKEGVNYKPNVADRESGFPITVVDVKVGNSVITYKIVYKPLKGGGSGAGAAATKLGESSQALYAAMANVLGKNISQTDLTEANFMKAKPLAITDEDFKKMVNELPNDWIHSSIMGANELRRKYSDKKFEYHRGSKKVDIVENTFKKINRVERAFGDINKWSPADIYIIEKGFDPSVLDKETTLKGLNEKMFELLKENKLIGVSLKKIEGRNAKMSQKNFPTDKKMSTAAYGGTSSTFESMDGYVRWGNATTEKIQFRSFGGETSLTGWQGEIKGASANQGKVSLGPINYVLRRHGLKELPTSQESATLAKQNSEKHAQDIAKMMVEYGMIKGDEEEAAVKTIMGKSNKYRYSKYLVLKMLLTMENAKKDVADAVTQDLYLYASSQASFSAPYLKLE